MLASFREHYLSQAQFQSIDFSGNLIKLEAESQKPQEEEDSSSRQFTKIGVTLGPVAIDVQFHLPYLFWSL